MVGREFEIGDWVVTDTRVSEPERWRETHACWGARNLCSCVHATPEEVAAVPIKAGDWITVDGQPLLMAKERDFPVARMGSQ